MRELIMTVGISGSGKSTWAEGFINENENYIEVNRDNCRFSHIVENKRVKDWSLYKFNKKNETKVTNICDNIVNNLKEASYDIIISDTNLNPKTRNKWKQWCEDNNYKFTIREFPIRFEEAIKRNDNRQGGVSTKVLWNQWMNWLEYINYDFYVPNEELPKAFICDIDGTVASYEGVRNVFDWDKVDLDKPREEIISIVHGMIELGYTPIFLSGRDGSCKNKTYDWIMDNIMEHYLEPNGGFYLFMRPARDSRKDSVIKKELFDKYLRNKFNIKAAIDDRHSIIRLWNQLKIPNVINVNTNLYNEF